MKMTTMPPLDLLPTFETVARLGSFTLAANALCITQSAISRQIRQLEDRLGKALFVRHHRSIELTQEGKLLFDFLSRHLRELETCISMIASIEPKRPVTIAASVSFSYFWLMPRLHLYIESNPDIELKIVASDNMADLFSSDVDISIVLDTGDWTGSEADLLFAERVYPVCNAEYLARHGDLKDIGDLPGQILLHLEGGGNIWRGMDWNIWLNALGVAFRPGPGGIRMNSYPMLLAAAETGRGVALGWDYITDELVAAGRLLKPVAESLSTGRGYYVSSPRKSLAQPGVAALRQWIITEARSRQPDAVT